MSFAVMAVVEKPKRPLIMATLSLIGLFLAAAFAEASDVDPAIQIRSVVEVDGKKTEITLGDLIVARGVRRTTLDSLKDIRLADTPKPGESRAFTAMGIEEVFRPHLREIESRTGERITLRVPNRVTVVRETLRLNADDVAVRIKSRLKDLCSDCEFEISNLSLPIVPTTIPAGSTWDVKTRNEIPRGSFSMPLEVNHEDGGKRTYWISGVLAVRLRIPVASRALQAGERFASEDFTLQSRDVTFATDSAPSEKEISSSIAARAIGAGQIIWRGNLRREVAVKTGDMVKVVAGNGGWQVMIDGVAQGSAYIGDMLKVKIPRTQKMVSGLVSEKGIVEVR